MFKVILSAPMLFVLKLKLRAMKKVLAMAEEQRRDAADLGGCIRCITSETGCTGDPECRLDKFRRNEALARTEVAHIEFRIEQLVK